MTGEWWLDHPVKAILTLGAASTAGGAAAVLVAWLLITVHALSPNNVLVGFAMGSGGGLLGAVAGAAIIRRLNRRAAA